LSFVKLTLQTVSQSWQVANIMRLVRQYCALKLSVQ